MHPNPDTAVVDRLALPASDFADWPSSRGIRAGVPLAFQGCEKGRGVSRGILVALLAAGLSACLVPQSVDQGNTGPHTIPVIDLSQLPIYFMAPTSPLYKQAQDDKTQQCRCQLQLQIPVVNDDDPTIDLQARWYIDYDLGTPPSQLPANTQDLAGSFTTQGRSRTGPTFNFDADTLGLNAGLHVIEVVIAERQGFAGDNDQTVNFPHRSLKPGFEGTTFKFVADVKDSAPGVTQCDRNTPLRSPPLIRSCAQ
jgi:hypothetical protein